MDLEALPKQPLYISRDYGCRLFEITGQSIQFVSVRNPPPILESTRTVIVHECWPEFKNLIFRFARSLPGVRILVRIEDRCQVLALWFIYTIDVNHAFMPDMLYPN